MPYKFDRFFVNGQVFGLPQRRAEVFIDIYNNDPACHNCGVIRVNMAVKCVEVAQPVPDGFPMLRS